MQIKHKVKPIKTVDVLKLSLTKEEIYFILADLTGDPIKNTEGVIYGKKINLRDVVLQVFPYWNIVREICKISKEENGKIIIALLYRVLVNILKNEPHTYTYADDNYEFSIILKN